MLEVEEEQREMEKRGENRERERVAFSILKLFSYVFLLTGSLSLDPLLKIGEY